MFSEVLGLHTNFILLYMYPLVCSYFLVLGSFLCFCCMSRCLGEGPEFPVVVPTLGWALYSLTDLILTAFHSAISPVVSGLVNISLSLCSSGFPKTVLFAAFSSLWQCFPTHLQWAGTSLMHYFLYYGQSFWLSVSIWLFCCPLLTFGEVSVTHFSEEQSSCFLISTWGPAGKCSFALIHHLLLP